MTRARTFSSTFALAALASASLALPHCARATAPARDGASPAAATSRAPAHVEIPAETPAVEASASSPSPEATASPTDTAPPDPTYRGDALTDATRSEYAITLPDERATLPVERALRIDDDGERAAALFFGAGLPLVPGLRVCARAGWLGFVLSASSGTRYRTISADALQLYLLGHPPPRASTSPVLRRTGHTLYAARGGLSATLEFDPQGPTRPLPCRLVVALLLGGDLTAARAACSDATPLRRAVLRAPGYAALAIDRTRTAAVRLPRAQLAVPPEGAPSDLALPTRPASGAFYSPAELRSLGGVREARHSLTVTNALPREVLVFVDDLALGWLAPGDTARFEGLASEEHPVRYRSLDGALRTPVVDRVFPTSMRPALGPAGYAVPHLPAPRQDAGP